MRAEVTYPKQTVQRKDGTTVTVKHQTQTQAVRKSNADRALAYAAQTGRPVTPRQRRRIIHKETH